MYSSYYFLESGVSVEDKYEKSGWTIETISEMVNDWIAFEFILELKRRMKNVEAKNYLSTFLMTIAPVIVYEVAESLELQGIVAKKDFFNPGMDKRVQKEREKFVKRIIVKSTQPKLIETEMGLNFKEKVYDINVLVKDNELMDMNYELFNKNIKEDFEFWDSLFGLPKGLINTLFSCLNIDKRIEDVYDMTDGSLNELAERIEQEFICERYSYSVHKLFSCADSLEDIDKILILYRYRLVTSAIRIEKAVPNFNIHIGETKVFDIKAFMRKYRAVTICIIGSGLKAMNTKFAQGIQTDLQNKIGDGAFWGINRKLRNNIHYQRTEVLTENEINILDTFQSVYFDIIFKHFQKNIFIDIDKECKTMTGFLKACHDKGMNKADIDKYYYYYYMKYVIFGRV